MRAILALAEAGQSTASAFMIRALCRKRILDRSSEDVARNDYAFVDRAISITQRHVVTISAGISMPIEIARAEPVNSIALLVSGDSYQGAPEFAVKVDGALVGPQYSTSALRKSDQSEQILISGISHNAKYITVLFQNDLYNGNPLQDRNLYVDAVNLNGTQQPGRSALFSTNFSGNSTAMYGNNDFAVFRLNSASSYANPAEELSENKEFFDIVDLYRGLLGRNPDEEGLIAYATFASSPDKLNAVTNSILTSQEFVNGRRNFSNAEFVDVLYAGILKRAPDEAGRANWLNALSGGITRAQVATAFVTGAENQNQFLDEIGRG